MKPPRGWPLGLLFAVCLGRLWLMALPSGFWVDETVTAFVVERPHDPSLAVVPQVPASLYYDVARAAVKLWGSSEVAYRIPSLLAMLAAVWVVARLAARLIHPDAAWFAAFSCLALHGIDYFAVDARPYALGMLVAAGAVWFLVRWLDTARWTAAAGFALGAALIWRIHLIYWPFYMVLALYAALRVRLKRTAVGWGRLALVFGAAALALVPVARQAVSLEHEAGEHVIVALPSWRDLLHLLRWNVVLFAAAGAWLLRKLSRTGMDDEEPNDANLSTILILSWWLAPPILLYGVSRASGQSVFIVRYLSVALPGIALAATLAAGRFLPVRHWRAAAALMGLGALAVLGQWTTVWPAHEKSGWREAAAEVNRVVQARAMPVICPSPFIEARWPAWRPDYPLPGFLYAHLAYYPVRGQLVLFPYAYEDSPRADVYAAQILAGELAPRGEFLIYGGAAQTRFWQKWFAARPELRGWQNRRHQFGDVYVAHFWVPR